MRECELGGERERRIYGPALTASSSAVLASLAHLEGHRVELVGIEHHPGRGEDRPFLLLDVGSVRGRELRGQGIESGDRCRVVGNRVEPFDEFVESRVQREMFAVLPREASEERRELDVVPKTRKEGGLLVLLMTAHGAREEGGDVADGVHVHRRIPRLTGDRDEIFESLFEATMRAFELLERISSISRRVVHFFGAAKALR